MEKKPDTYTRRFIEWAYFHSCPILFKYDTETEWKPFLSKKFNWKTCNYKIDNLSHQTYYERLYTHGNMN